MAFGFEVRNPTGETVIDENDAQLYVISRHYVPHKSTSYISEPNFDSNDGEIILKQHYTPIYNTATIYGAIPVNWVALDSYANQTDTNIVNYQQVVGSFSNLIFNWNNTTKVFSWTAPSMTFGETWIGFQLGSNAGWFHDQGNFEVVFMRYN